MIKVVTLHSFLDLDPEETSANHSTLSRTRRRIDVETHGKVFRVLGQLAEAGLVRGKTIGDRCDDVGSERGDAQLGAPGHRRRL